MESCGLVSVCFLRPLKNLQSLNLCFNKIVYVDNEFNSMKKLQQLNLSLNLISDFTSLQKHPNFSKFNLLNQRPPLYTQLLLANKVSNIENTNIQLIKINKQCLKMSQFKQKINALTENTQINLIQFTSNVVRLFQVINNKEYFE
ncbi:Leucine-rich_repeat domain superfamily [Hexamita inflata]|uniref:Leucine-rich repeat domain superfamily n=1 Tax=Hexamita inflata TaxID=28002 RepID=A0AA86PCW4_9EUKA|nr:Leucine-rich repeat domain superfamily [Hexamita inflata]